MGIFGPGCTRAPVDAKMFLELLKRLVIDANKSMFVIDGHPIRKVRLIKAYVEGLEDNLKLFYLPPHSPHLNPDETIWAQVKREVSRQLV